MGAYTASQMIKALIKRKIHVDGARILVMGLTFKENCPDVRNTKVVDIVNELESYQINLSIYDPWAIPNDVKHEYNISTLNEVSLLAKGSFDAIILAVSHDEFKSLDIKSLLKSNAVVYDVKGVLSKNLIDQRL